MEAAIFPTTDLWVIQSVGCRISLAAIEQGRGGALVDENVGGGLEREGSDGGRCYQRKVRLILCTTASTAKTKYN